MLPRSTLSQLPAQLNALVPLFALQQAINGVIATDPIDANAAAWLRGQIQERFKQPIRYVIYSHDHADHIAGGAVLKEAGATVIAQLNGHGYERLPASKGFLGHVGGHRSLLDLSCS